MGFFNPIIVFLQFLAMATVASLHILASGLVPHPIVVTSSATVTQPVVIASSTPPAPIVVQKIAATTPKVKTVTPIAPAASPALSTAVSAPAPVVQPVVPTEDPQTVNANTRAALVNILCTTGAGGYFSPISGSGVIIDTRGVVLTNAHVGQFFLLRDYPQQNNITCVLRTGSPAQNAYTAELLYLPPAWINTNASQITAQHATGTGENDYSFLLITGSTNPGVNLPSTFPVLAMTVSPPSDGDQMLLASYPAGFLDGQTIQTNLYISSAIAAVQQLYTFDDPTHVDAIDVGGTVVSQSGSSGGAVVRLTDGKLVGIISTDTAGSTTADRELDAITISHIDRSLASEGQGGIVQLLSGDVAAKAAVFASTTAPSETQALEAVLNSNKN